MKQKKWICLVLSVLLLLTTLAACRGKDGDADTDAENGGIFAFDDYESDEVFDIEKVDLNEKYADKVVSYRFTYLSDGLKIKAYLSIPSSAIEAQQPVKCLLYNRGGNRDLGLLKDNSTAAVCAMCDRIVIASQYRGSSGSQGEDQFGGDDLHDVIRLIDLCEKNFSFVDMDDFCVAGASRGGMMTYMAARQDSRIKRIIAISAVSNLFESYVSREDTMKDMMVELIGCSPTEKPEEYQKRSAIFWYSEIKIPVLIFHCKEDQQVSYYQAEALYANMKDTTDCTLITHDDDTHGSLHQEDVAVVQEFLSQN